MLVNIMKNKILFFLFLLLTIPCISVGAEMHTLEVEFSFTPPDDPARTLLGYRLYKEGEQVCETNDADASAITCDLQTDEGTFDFTLTAYYSDNTESPASPSFPFTIEAIADIPSDPISTTPEPPTAVLYSSTAVGNAPLIVTFDGASSTTTNGSIVGYNWTFGDDTPDATGETTSHTFTTAGTYSTTLTVIDSEGLSSSVSTPIIVIGTAPANEAPTAVITVNASPTGDLMTFTFSGSQSSDPDGTLAQFSWEFDDETTGTGETVSHTFASEGTHIIKLTITDDQGATATTSTAVDCVNNTTVNEAGYIPIEVGELTIKHNWTTVSFENTFSHPVVVAGPPSFNGGAPVLVRVRNVTETGFEVRLQEWAYLDGTHAAETFSYIVIEKGIYTLEDGSKIEAGTFDGTTSFTQVPLQQTYDVTPVILAQVMTENETDAVTERIRYTNQYSFEFMFQEMQATMYDHIPETVGYIAWEPGKGEVSGLRYEIGMTERKVNERWFDLNFETEFSDLPFFIAGMQTCSGIDTAAVRHQNLLTSSVEIRLQEETSQDDEARHAKEVVGYFTIGTATAVE